MTTTGGSTILSETRLEKPTAKRGVNGRFVSNKNVANDHQLCTGPSHEEPTWLPATEKYFHRHRTGPRAGKLLSRCRLCVNWNKLKNPGSHHGLVPMDKAWPTINEAINRIGLRQLALRTGLSESGLFNIQMKRQRSVQKATLRKVMLELISAKRKGETPHPTAVRLNHQRLHRGRALCSGCGTDAANYTEGCPQCWERKKKREKRKGG